MFWCIVNNQQFGIDIIKVLQLRWCARKYLEFTVTFFIVLSNGLKICRSTIFFFFKEKNMSPKHRANLRGFASPSLFDWHQTRNLYRPDFVDFYLFALRALKNFLPTQGPNFTLELITSCHLSWPLFLFASLKTVYFRDVSGEDFSPSLGSSLIWSITITYNDNLDEIQAIAC